VFAILITAANELRLMDRASFGTNKYNFNTDEEMANKIKLKT
jgi:hypothetical protein